MYENMCEYMLMYIGDDIYVLSGDTHVCMAHSHDRVVTTLYMYHMCELGHRHKNHTMFYKVDMIQPTFL